MTGARWETQDGECGMHAGLAEAAAAAVICPVSARIVLACVGILNARREPAGTDLGAGRAGGFAMAHLLLLHWRDFCP